MCPGFRLVFAEVAYTMVTILREFERIESRDDRPWTEESRATFQNLHGAKVALFPAEALYIRKEISLQPEVYQRVVVDSSVSTSHLSRILRE